MAPIFNRSRLRRQHYAVVTAFIILSIYFLGNLDSPTTETIIRSTTLYQSGRSHKEGLSSRNIAKINNATLGFAHIYALNLPTRTDKRDAMDLSATLTNISLTWRDGVDGKDMHPNAIPPAHDGDGEFTKDGEVGCWRGHMNIIREIATSGIGSALLLEDDADWDVNIKSQLEDLAIAVHDTVKLLPEEKRACSSSAEDSPYGSCWDILWIGHCGGWAPGEKFHQYHSIIRGDNTVPPTFDIEDLTNDISKTSAAGLPCAAHAGKKLDHGAVCKSPMLRANERIVQYKGSPICTFGYAVSQQGAQKMLARMGGISLVDIDSNMDTEMTELCRGDKDGGKREAVQCFSIVPPLIMSHRPRGLKSADSDINKGGKEMRKMGMTKGIMYSTRLNTENLIAGFEPEEQYVKEETTGLVRYKEAAEYKVI